MSTAYTPPGVSPSFLLLPQSLFHTPRIFTSSEATPAERQNSLDKTGSRFQHGATSLHEKGTRVPLGSGSRQKCPNFIIGGFDHREIAPAYPTLQGHRRKRERVRRRSVGKHSMQSTCSCYAGYPFVQKHSRRGSCMESPADGKAERFLGIGDELLSRPFLAHAPSARARRPRPNETR